MWDRIFRKDESSARETRTADEIAEELGHRLYEATTIPEMLTVLKEMRSESNITFQFRNLDTAYPVRMRGMDFDQTIKILEQLNKLPNNNEDMREQDRIVSESLELIRPIFLREKVLSQVENYTRTIRYQKSPGPNVRQAIPNIPTNTPPVPGESFLRGGLQSNALSELEHSEKELNNQAQERALEQKRYEIQQAEEKLSASEPLSISEIIGLLSVLERHGKPLSAENKTRPVGKIKKAITDASDAYARKDYATLLYSLSQITSIYDIDAKVYAALQESEKKLAELGDEAWALPQPGNKPNLDERAQKYLQPRASKQ